MFTIRETGCNSKELHGFKFCGGQKLFSVQRDPLGMMLKEKLLGSFSSASLPSDLLFREGLGQSN